ncbi:hypothetical protein [Streptomyces tailanensis]|uniref:hypothetical protein n=1 Tax=Streptomyces tailanensis TaxID=2569858 RepID=UPI00122E4378|nr:hypothetical protein [Streptomyces tailanensis]
MAIASGAVVAAWNLETRVSPTPHGPRVHVIPRDFSVTEGLGEDCPTLHLMAPPSAERLTKESASVIVVDATRNGSSWGSTKELDDKRNAEFDVLENAVRQHPGALIVGAVTGRCRALVWVRVQPPSVWEPVGYTVSVRTEEAEGGNPEFYPSAIYGWMRWWLENIDRSTLPEDYPVGVLLPQPPQSMDMVLDEGTTRLLISYALRPIPLGEVSDPEDPLFR